MSAAPGSHPITSLPLASLFCDRSARSGRASSFDSSGGNEDWMTIGPGETAVLLEHDGAGCITHLYCAWMFPDVREYRNAILRCYWDGASSPSVEVPLGDFFGIPRGDVREYASPYLAVNGGCGVSHGLNAYFPMPFSSAASITLENRGPSSLGGPWEAFWYHVDYETYAEPLPDDAQTFHASYRQAGTPGVDAEGLVAVDTTGRGRLAGLTFDGDPGTEVAEIDGVSIRADSRPELLHFGRSLRWTARDACASVAYWYQSPAAVLPQLPAADALVPSLDPAYDTAREALNSFVLEPPDAATGAQHFRTACEAGRRLYAGDYESALEILATSR